jgi:hypothetical protein
MRSRVLLMAAVVGVLTGFMALSDDVAACGRRRCRAPCYCPPPVVYYCPPAASVPPAPPTAQPRAVTIGKKTYYVLPSGEEGENDQEELQGKRSVFSRSSGIPETDIFDGTVRKIAKVTIFEGQMKPFDSVGHLREWLPYDRDMRDLDIGRGPDVDRVKQEKFNVTLTAYIYTFRKEGDNDYHVIIGDGPDTPNRKYINAEVSGIPEVGTDENRAQLWKVRNAFKQTFQLDAEGPDTYLPLEPPVPVQITGSLFWDVEHYPNTVGPRFASPKTAWEIHPISRINFLE